MPYYRRNTNDPKCNALKFYSVPFTLYLNFKFYIGLPSFASFRAGFGIFFLGFCSSSSSSMPLSLSSSTSLSLSSVSSFSSVSSSSSLSSTSSSESLSSLTFSRSSTSDLLLFSSESSTLRSTLVLFLFFGSSISSSFTFPGLGVVFVSSK